MNLLAGRLGTLQLATPIRFAAGWERQASLRFRADDTSVLADYDAHGQILGGPAEEVIEHAAQHYVALILAGTDVLLMAQDHAHRRELCRRIRGELIYLGRVAADPSVSIADGQEASPGDLIVCTRNDHTLQAGEPGRTLANGDLLHIEHITREGLVVRRAVDADPAPPKAVEQRLPVSRLRRRRAGVCGHRPHRPEPDRAHRAAATQHLLAWS
jgi:hypothetical protein